MSIDEIAWDILKQENNQLAQAFTMVIGRLLLSKDIQPIINKSREEWNENDDLNKYIIRKTYDVTFDIDTSEHDAKIGAEVIDDFIRFIFGRNIIHNRRFTTREEEYFLNMAEQFKEQLKKHKNSLIPTISNNIKSPCCDCKSDTASCCGCPKYFEWKSHTDNSLKE